MHPSVDDPIDYIDKSRKMIHYKSGAQDPLTDEEYLTLAGTSAQRDISKGVEEQELAADERVKNLTGSPGLNTFLKNASDNTFTRFATDYLADPLVAGAAAIETREGQEDSNFFERMGQNYLAQRVGRRSARQQMDQENPDAAFYGQGAALGIDLATPLPKALRNRPVATGALFGAGASDRSVFEDPEKFAESTALGAGIGYVGSKVFDRLERVASQRRALRMFESSEAEGQRVFQEKLTRFNELEQKSQEAFKRANALANREDAASQKAYQRALREYESLTTQAESAYEQAVNDYIATVGEKLGGLEKEVGPWGIHKGSMDVDRFLQENIAVSADVGSKESKSMWSFLKGLELNLPEKMAVDDVKRLYNAIDTRIAKGTEYEIDLLSRFKDHLLDTLPEGAAHSKLAQKFGGRVERDIVRSVNRYLESLPKNTVRELERIHGNGVISKLKDSIKNDVSARISEMSPREMSEVLSSGESSIVRDVFAGNELFNEIGQDLIFDGVRLGKTPAYTEAQVRLLQLEDKAANALGTSLQKQALSASIEGAEVADKVSRKIANATGSRNPQTGKMGTNVPPQQQNIPQPQQPSLADRPLPLVPGEAPQAPIPGVRPQVGRMAERFETQPMNLGRDAVKSGAGYGILKYLLGGKAAAAYGGVQGGKMAIEGVLRGITSPGAIASHARSMGGKEGMRLIVSTLSSYPSYENGVLQSPEERRQAVAEIEGNGSIPLQDKAMLQAYINRGKDLENLLRE